MVESCFCDANMAIFICFAATHDKKISRQTKQQKPKSGAKKMIEQFITLDIINLCALLFVILIGLPHGAFDGAIAAHLGA